MHMEFLVLPESIKPIRSKLCIPDNMLDIPVPHVVLNRPGIVPVIG